ncbi:MAG: M48 family metallopeptidase [Betaproteobacteria bacterium]|jgi:predicted metal-dependent hydrolase|nr:M48 family metallopeptidase [Rhodocyclaceae bacterium]MCA3134800.1 M48 family metallopeptidase [Rhodocyclaceae bacterium]MCA3142282.1 M48 family metallopeptidase [Rhodocyclaceae bacterium]MCA3146429.1 M48 family metallopeptidase [Rhodocyclaceae bacterium]MCE2897275.1 M48 family metallopeptidase [Betaproteobacteria bacterium]
MDDLFPANEVEERPCSIELRGREVPFVLKRSQRRRRIAFLVNERGLAVHAPWRASESVIDGAIRDAARWILAKLDDWQERPRARLRAWGEGEALDFLGRNLTLALQRAQGLTVAELVNDDTLRLWLPEPDDAARVRQAVVRWYRRHAERHMPPRVEHFAERLGVARPRVLLSDARTRWGSCNAGGEVRLNWRLMQAPEALIDYVVAHEVAHLLHLNHSPRFWRAVERIYPAWETARAELAATSHHYMSL